MYVCYKNQCPNFIEPRKKENNYNNNDCCPCLVTKLISRSRAELGDVPVRFACQLITSLRPRYTMYAQQFDGLFRFARRQRIKLTFNVSRHHNFQDSNVFGPRITRVFKILRLSHQEAENVELHKFQVVLYCTHKQAI